MLEPITRMIRPDASVLREIEGDPNAAIDLGQSPDAGCKLHG
jgi:hypothetical protein